MMMTLLGRKGCQHRVRLHAHRVALSHIRHHVTIGHDECHFRQEGNFR